MQLLDAREQVRAHAALGVVRRTLMWVLAVGEVELLLEDWGEDGRERFASREPGAIAASYAAEVAKASPRAAGATRARLRPTHGAPRARLVVLGAAERRHVGEVLRRAAQHRRPADVDHLDRLLLADAVPRGDLVERVEVDADQVEQLDPVLGERRQVGLDVAPGEETRVDVRVERLHPTAEHLRELGQLVDASSPAGPSSRGESRCRRSQPAPSRGRPAPSRARRARLVERRDQRRTVLSRLPAAAGARRRGPLDSVSRGWTGTGSWRITAPVSSPSSTWCTVAPVVAPPPRARPRSRARPGTRAAARGGR